MQGNACVMGPKCVVPNLGTPAGSATEIHPSVAVSQFFDEPGVGTLELLAPEG